MNRAGFSRFADARAWILAGCLSASVALLAEAPDDRYFDPESAPLEELVRRCEVAREEMIAPLRNAEIERCKADTHNDPAFCERFYRTYGDSTFTADGTFVPRLFDNLPECVLLDKERKRRLRLGIYE